MPSHVIILNQHDRRGLLTQSVIDPNTGGTGLGIYKLLSYNGQGVKLNLTQGDARQAEQYSKNWTVDSLSRTVGDCVEPKGLALTTQHTLDGVGNITAVTDPNQNTTRYYYDLNNAKRFSVNPDGNVMEWEKDSAGRDLIQRS